MSSTNNKNEQITTFPSPKTPKLIKPPCRSSYEAIDDSSNESNNTTSTRTITKSKHRTKKQLVASTNISIANASSPSEVGDNGGVTWIHINIDFTDILETPTTTKIPEPDDLDDPIKDLIRLLKKDINDRQAARAARTARRSQKSLASSSCCSGFSSTPSNFTSLEAVDDYQNLGMVKRGLRQQLPDGPSTIAARHVSSIPDNQLTPKKFLLGKKRREYVVLGDLNRSH